MLGTNVNSVVRIESALREANRGIETGAFLEGLDLTRTNLIEDPNRLYASCSKCDDESDYKWAKSVSERIEQRDRIRDLAKKKASQGETYHWRTYKTLSSCRYFASVDEDGDPSAINRTCTCTRCPFCSVVAQKRTYHDTKNAIHSLILEGQGPDKQEGNYFFVTLTVRHRSTKMGVEFYRLKQTMKRFKNTRWWRSVMADKETSGTVWRNELTKTNEYPHWHQHLLVKTSYPMTVTLFENLLRRTWTSKSVGGGKVLRVKRVRTSKRTDITEHNEVCISQSGEQGSAIESDDKEIELGNLLNELIAYTVKRTELSDEDYLDFITTGYKQPMSGFTGVFKAKVKENKEKETIIEKEEAPPPPSRVNDVTGEVALLPKGKYTFPNLFKMAYEYGNWSAVWAIRTIRWKQRYEKSDVIEERIKTKQRLDNHKADFVGLVIDGA